MTIEQELVKKLRSSNLRPTKQRLEICRVLFDRQKTFHFTISDLAQILNEKSKNKISLATIYNTVDVLKSKGHLKEISINSDKTFFDTNICLNISISLYEIYSFLFYILCNFISDISKFNQQNNKRIKFKKWNNNLV